MKTFAILMATLLVFSVMPMIAAQESVVEPVETEIIDAGVTPDSPFYGLERAMERLRLAFTRNKANRALYKIRMAEERLAEAEQMLEENNLEAAQEAEEAHDEIIEEAEQEAEEIETDTDEEVAEEALEDVEQIQLRLLSHSEKVALVHNRILERLRAGNASEEQLQHLSEVFARIQAKAQEIEQKIAEKRERVRTRYKVLSEKEEDELTEREQAFLERIEAAKQRREEVKERIREKGFEAVNESEEDQDEVECVVDEDCDEGYFCDNGECEEIESEDESQEETGNQTQAGQ
jgi:hypothetical protein